jgi:hypothetical protein
MITIAGVLSFLGTLAGALSGIGQVAIEPFPCVLLRFV